MFGLLWPRGFCLVKVETCLVKETRMISRFLYSSHWPHLTHDFIIMFIYDFFFFIFEFMKIGLSYSFLFIIIYVFQILSAFMYLSFKREECFLESLVVLFTQRSQHFTSNMLKQNPYIFFFNKKEGILRPNNLSIERTWSN